METYKHLEEQCKTVEDVEVLQKHSILGGEAKPLPYMLCQMNLLLHGLEFPQIDPENSLRFPLREIGDKDRVDVILTNPPFGGEEERGILGNFPEDKQTSETTLLFLQLIMRKLRRAPAARAGGRGRAQRHALRGWSGGADQRGAAQGVQPAYHCAAAQRRLCALHQHSHQPALLRPLRADQEIWYYELPLPEGRKNYTKTKPMQFEEFADCLAWWKERAEGERAWRVPAEQIAKNGYNLDIKNPERKEGSGATAAGGAGGVDTGQGRADRGDHGRDQVAAGGEEMNEPLARWFALGDSA